MSQCYLRLNLERFNALQDAGALVNRNRQQKLLENLQRLQARMGPAPSVPRDRANVRSRKRPFKMLVARSEGSTRRVCCSRWSARTSRRWSRLQGRCSAAPVHMPGRDGARVMAMVSSRTQPSASCTRARRWRRCRRASVWPTAHRLNITGHGFLPHAATVVELFGPTRALETLRHESGGGAAAWFQVRVAAEVCCDVQVLSNTHLTCVYPVPLVRAAEAAAAAAAAAAPAGCSA